MRITNPDEGLTFVYQGWRRFRAISIFRREAGVVGPDEPIPARRADLADETVLGQTCTWWDVSFTADNLALGCRALDGAPLKIKRNAWGRTSELVAVRYRSAAPPLDAALPPRWMSAPRTWLRP